MTANELRVGNSLIDSRNNEIHVVSGNSIHSMQYTGSTEILKPIPLTEEWLLKFGFKYNSYSSYNLFINDFLLVVSFEDYNCNVFIGVSYDDIDFKHIKHVHQLQNLYFSLTGDELTL